ncbi:MAG: hypothetical protein IPO08_19455 [Xanthomonadales bacterium]|jgi:hypothetical protein|nr:hypothetical protein [Xanthomonadales bacterium]
MNMNSHNEIVRGVRDLMSLIQFELHIENGHEEYAPMLRALGHLAEVDKELETVPRVEILL